MEVYFQRVLIPKEYLFIYFFITVNKKQKWILTVVIKSKYDLWHRDYGTSEIKLGQVKFLTSEFIILVDEYFVGFFDLVSEKGYAVYLHQLLTSID